MIKEKMLTPDESILFAKNLFRIYLEEHNVQHVISLLHKDITWFAPNYNKLCSNFNEVIELLNIESSSWNVRLHIVSEWYDSISFDDKFSIVFGQLGLTTDSFNNINEEIQTRFSIICCRTDTQIKLYHAHFSVLDAEQINDAFSRMILLHNQNLLLEQQLNERTMELDNLAHNIYGGILVCSYDDSFSILYANDGYQRLTGYTFEETKNLIENMHVSIVFQEDIVPLHEKVKAQLDIGESYEVEYRIIRKDGALVWILEKGVLLSTDYNPPKLQCVLTDITKQKHVEETLRISEQRYKIAIGFSDVNIFEYNIVTGEFLLPEPDAILYGVPTNLSNGYETMIDVGIIAPESHNAFRLMFQEIINGAPTAQSHIHTIDIDGNMYEYELNLTNIFDSAGSPIHAVGYRKNITELCQLQKNMVEIKEREVRSTEEQKLYESMVAKSLSVYSLNVSKNCFLSGEDNLKELFQIKTTGNYAHQIQELCETVIYPDDKTTFINTLSWENLCHAYANKTYELVCEYRRPLHGAYIWVRTTIHLFNDPQTNDIKSFFYVENINDMKLHELETLYKAEHDLLTGFYNKTATERKITSFLDTDEGTRNSHAFFIIDADYFKQINDNFGHAFGDVVLSQMASKMNNIFREIDILGRIGGDEFIAFMKNVPDDEAALMKAQEICNQLSDSFSKYDTQCNISVSVGIAFYERHGKTYHELYNNSDIALYTSKERGRNQYTLYNEQIPSIQNRRKQLDLKQLLDNKSFEEHVTEYFF